jgi:hypothetical protein
MSICVAVAATPLTVMWALVSRPFFPCLRRVDLVVIPIGVAGCKTFGSRLISGMWNSTPASRQRLAMNCARVTPPPFGVSNRCALRTPFLARSFSTASCSKSNVSVSPLFVCFESSRSRSSSRANTFRPKCIQCFSLRSSAFVPHAQRVSRSERSSARCSSKMSRVKLLDSSIESVMPEPVTASSIFSGRSFFPAGSITKSSSR